MEGWLGGRTLGSLLFLLSVHSLFLTLSNMIFSVQVPLSVPNQPGAPKHQQMYSASLPQHHGPPDSEGVHAPPTSDASLPAPGASSSSSAASVSPLQEAVQDMSLSEGTQLPMLPQALTPAPVTVLRSSSNPSQHVGMGYPAATYSVAPQVDHVTPPPAATQQVGLPGTLPEQQVAARPPLVPMSCNPAPPPPTSLSSFSGLSSMPPSIRLPVVPTISLNPTVTSNTS